MPTTSTESESTRARQDPRLGYRKGRLNARLPSEPSGDFPAGLHQLQLSRGRDGLLYVPRSYQNEKPSPLLMMLHGAGGEARGAIASLHTLADEAGLIIVAPESRGRTWDLILGEYGPDVEFIDRALEFVFERLNINSTHLASAGFSDGASYGLSLAIINGDLFTHGIAFSPGFFAPTGQPDSPRIFISHGTDDTVLPINSCSRKLAPAIRKAGYDLQYLEFSGGHIIPDNVAREALTWFLTPIADKMGM